MDLLQEDFFVSLDIFRKILYDKNIRGKDGFTSERILYHQMQPSGQGLDSKWRNPIDNWLEAWLVFLGIDDPKMIAALLEKYPDYCVMYTQVYELCRNMEDIMGIFSEELKISDRNTVQYMMDEMQETINQERKAIEERVSYGTERII